MSTTTSRSTRWAAVLLVGIAAVAPSRATETERGVAQGAGIITRFGASASAVTYWVSRPDGFEVVTTIDTKANGGDAENDRAIARFSSRLLPGQSQVISVPAALGEPQPTLHIRRIKDRIEVENGPSE